jgi:N-acetylneuraminic acid mutarotase
LNVAVVGGDIVVLGALGGGFSEFPATWLYDVSADSWDTQTLTPAPVGQERGSSAMGVIDGVVYIAGGLRGGSAVTLASTYDVANGAWATLDPLPAKRDHLVGAAHGGRFYAVGGRTGTISGVKGEVFEYDPAGAGGWLSKSPLPTPRGGIAGATLNSVLYVFGGEGSAEPGGLFSQVEAYDFAADSWTVLAPMPTPVHGTGAASWNGKIYIPGGGIVAAFGASDIFQVYSP